MLEGGLAGCAAAGATVCGGGGGGGFGGGALPTEHWHPANAMAAAMAPMPVIPLGVIRMRVCLLAGEAMGASIGGTGKDPSSAVGRF